MSNDVKSVLAGFLSLLILISMGVGFTFHPHEVRRILQSEKWNRIFLGVGRPEFGKYYVDSWVYIFAMRLLGIVCIAVAAFLVFSLFHMLR